MNSNAITTETSIHRIINFLVELHHKLQYQETHQKLQTIKEEWQYNQNTIMVPTGISLIRMLNEYAESIKYLSLGTNLRALSGMIEIQTTIETSSKDRKSSHVPLNEDTYLHVNCKLYFVIKPYDASMIHAVGLEDSYEDLLCSPLLNVKDIETFFRNFSQSQKKTWSLDQMRLSLNYPKTHLFHDQSSLKEGYESVLRLINNFFVNNNSKLFHCILLVHDQDFYLFLLKELKRYNEWRQTPIDNDSNEIWAELLMKFSSLIPSFPPTIREQIQKSVSLIKNDDQRKFMSNLLQLNHIKLESLIQ